MIGSISHCERRRRRWSKSISTSLSLARRLQRATTRIGLRAHSTSSGRRASLPHVASRTRRALSGSCDVVCLRCIAETKTTRSIVQTTFAARAKRDVLRGFEHIAQPHDDARIAALIFAHARARAANVADADSSLLSAYVSTPIDALVRPTLARRRCRRVDDVDSQDSRLCLAAGVRALGRYRLALKSCHSAADGLLLH